MSSSTIPRPDPGGFVPDALGDRRQGTVSRGRMRGTVELVFSPEAGEALDELEKDAADAGLVDAIWDVLDLIRERPGSAQARYRALRTAGGHSVWLVPVRGRYEDEVWVVLWQPRDDDALIAFIGPEDFRRSR